MFDLRAHATSVRREIVAGCITYLTMAYIAVVWLIAGLPLLRFVLE